MTEAKQTPTVSPAEAKRLLDDEGYVYLDVRTAEEYAAGHPSGARNVPWKHRGDAGMAANPDFLAVVEALYPRDAKLVLACKAGGRSRAAAQALAAAGYDSLVDLSAGYGGKRNAFGAVVQPGWADAGLPTETSTEGGRYEAVRAEAGLG